MEDSARWGAFLLGMTWGEYKRRNGIFKDTAELVEALRGQDIYDLLILDIDWSGAEWNKAAPMGRLNEGKKSPATSESTLAALYSD